MGLKGHIADIQNDSMNKGWRIPWISPAEEGKPYVVPVKSWAGRLTPIVALGFLASIAWIVYAKENNNDFFPGVYLAGITFFSLLVLLFIENRMKKKSWQYRPAKCLDKEIQQIVSRNGKTWGARILCEIEYNDVTYKITPQVHWSTFRSEQKAIDFLENKISQDGSCVLMFNPSNPLEAELSEQAKRH